MQLLIIISLVLALVGGAPKFDERVAQWSIPTTSGGVVLLTVCSTAAVILLCLGYNLLTARRIDRTGELNRRRYRRGLASLGWLMVATFAAQVFLFRWSAVLLGWLHLGDVPVFGNLAVWSPFFLMLMGYWISAYLVDVRLRLLDMQGRLEAGLPVYAPGGAADRPIWSLGQFLGFQVRFNLLLVLLPLLAIMVINPALTAAFNWVEPKLEGWKLNQNQQGLILLSLLFAAVLGILVLFPPVLALVFSTRPLPKGPLADHLAAVLARAGARVRRVLLWNTHGMVSNAAVMGLWGRLRYVMLSDGLLETLPDEQIEGVFGHELGHVVHHHIIYYLMFLTSLLVWAGEAYSGLVSLPALAALAKRGPAAELLAQGGPLLAVGAVVLFLFGWVSRNFERQADLTGAQAITLGHLADSPLMPLAAPGQESAAGGRINLAVPPHPGAAEVYIAALFRIADINGLDRAQRTWRHGSILSRGLHLRRLCDPKPFRQFRLTILLIKLCILALVAGAVAMTLFTW